MNEFENFAPQGWQCPICKRIYAPNTPWCYFCGGETTVSTSTNIKQSTQDFIRKMTVHGTHTEAEGEE